MLAVAAYQDFEAVETVVKTTPEHADTIYKVLGADNLRALLRYEAGVKNASTFEVWEDVQIALGLALTLILFLASSARWLAVAPLVMTLLVVFLHIRITPDLVWLGRSLEFLPVSESLTRNQFWSLHRIYGILDTVKCLFGLVLTVYLVAQSSGKIVRRRHRHEPDPTAELTRHASYR